MAHEGWQRVREIFDSAIRREPAERQDYVNRVCGEDKQLLREVESLLSSLDHSDKFLETAAIAHVADLIGHSAFEKGKRFGHYEITRKIGAGGMGQVYLAQDLKLDRQVAIKILNRELSRDESNLKRFVREAKAASALNHPNIIVIHEIGESEGVHYLVSEFIEGKTLRDVLTQAQMSVREVLDAAIQIAGALAAAHGAHLVHRDIKPENVMVRPDGYLKVLDFGLAKLVEKNRPFPGPEASTVELGQTAKGMILGTVHYMSPEQAKGQEVDERTDIFSLGAMMYEMLAGKAPFAGDSMPETFANLINTEPQPVSRFVANVPDELQRIIAKTLRKNQDQRYQTMTDLLTDLRDLRENLSLEGKLVRSLSSNSSADSSAPETGAATRPTSSAEYFFNEIGQHKRGSLLILIAVVAATMVAVYFVASRNLRRGEKTALVGSSEASMIRSVAVLPLTNVSQNPDTEYLSDGVSESLINSLSRLPGMSVIARNSSFKYRGKDAESEEIAKALHVEGILTGRVLQRGDNLVISVELVDARTKMQVWGETYNRRATDVLQVQSEISREIVEKLRLRLTIGEQQQLSKLNKAIPEAYELLLKGRFSASKGRTDDRKKAIEFFQEAIAVDPAYALAYAELSRSYLGLVNNNILDQREFVPKAEAAAKKALELDDNLAEAHQAMAGVKMDQWDWTAAEREFKRALELNPNLVGAHVAYGYYLAIQRRMEENAVERKRARELDPLAPGINAMNIFELLSAGKNDQAIEAAKKLVELDQNNPGLHMTLADTYSKVGRFREAITAIQEAIKLGDTSPDGQIYLALAYANNGDHDKARGILRRLETGKEYVSPMGLASIYAAVGEKDQAFVLLEKAYAAHDQQLIWLGGPELAPLRSDPRFQDLVRRVGVGMP